MSAPNPSRLATLSLCSALWLAAGVVHAEESVVQPQETRISDGRAGPSVR